MLDAHATQVLATTDLISERGRKTGKTTLRSIGDISRRQTIKDNDAEYVAPQDMLAELREDNLKLVETLRAAKEAAGEAKDNATDSLIDDWTDEAEERAWFLRSEEHTSELQSLMRIAYAVCCLKKKKYIHVYHRILRNFTCRSEPSNRVSH